MSKTESTKTCCLCGKPIIGWGNNPYPVNMEDDAECCDDCNYSRVLPSRLFNMTNKGVTV